MKDLKPKNDVSVLNDFYGTDMRFMVLQLTEEEIGPFRYVSDMDTGERFIFVSHSPELYDGP